MKKIIALLLILVPLISIAQWFQVVGKDGKTYSVYARGSSDSTSNKINTRLLSVEKEDTIKFSSKYFSLGKGYVDLNIDSVLKGLSNSELQALSIKVNDALTLIKVNKVSLDSLIIADKIEKKDINSLIRTAQSDIITIKSNITTLQNNRVLDRQDIDALKVYTDKIKSLVITFPQ